MSNQSWIRRSSPSSSKSGPLKATLPMSSLTRQNSNLRQHSVDNSPVTLSPTSPWKTRASPDQLLSGIRSPGALNYKGKCHFSRHSIRRTASLDTIYLTGQWPRDFHASLLHLDKATQTEELDGKKGQRYTPDFTAVAEDKLDKMIRHRLLQRQHSNSRDNILQSRPRAMQEHSSQTTTPPPLRSPSRSAAPAHNMRSSTEGLNQEIERLVLRAMSSLGGSEGEEEKAIQITPEGHRAPLPDLLRLTRTVNTQTPSNDLLSPSKHLSPCDKLLSLADKQSPDSPASLSPPLCDTSRHTLSLSANTGRNLSPCGRQLMSSRNLSSTHFSSSPHFVALSPKALDSDESPEAEEMRGLGGGGGGGGVGGGSRSPKINRFLAREPPDGCERVSLKFTEDNSSKDLTALDYSDFKPSATFQLKPSAGSAFLPLSAPNKTPVASPANLSDT